MYSEKGIGPMLYKNVEMAENISRAIRRASNEAAVLFCVLAPIHTLRCFLSMLKMCSTLMKA